MTAETDPPLVEGTPWRLAPPGKDPTEWTTDELHAFIVCALRSRDMRAVVGAVHVLAVKDPQAAQNVLDAVEIAQAVQS